MNENSRHLGNEPVHEPLFIRKELALFEDDPLLPFLEALDTSGRFAMLHDELSRYVEAYYFFYLSLERYLEEMCYAIKWERDLKWGRGPGRRYTDYQKRIAKKYHATKHFLKYDFVNCLLHARILCDRTIALSRYFLRGERLPSFTSFNEHKKFFVRYENPIPEHGEYARYIRNETDWFEAPLKPVRDRFIVHSGPKHMRFLGWQSEYDLELALFVLAGDNLEKPLEKVITISIRRLARDIKQFLSWFSGYGLRSLDRLQP